MISIPVWVFVILIILVSITVLAFLFFVGLCIATLFQKPYEGEYENSDCPYEIDPIDDPDYNPEHIPLEGENKEHD